MTWLYFVFGQSVFVFVELTLAMAEARDLLKSFLASVPTKVGLVQAECS
jgi:hypothetical protein